nr:hypothetical protein [Tanacetum cinerariifolium]
MRKVWRSNTTNCDHFVEIPSGEIKVHIEVLSLLWGNRLPILDGALPLSRVKKLEKKQRSRNHKLKRLYKVGLTARVDSSENKKNLGEDASKQERIKAIDVDEDITLVNDQDDTKMFNVTDLHVNAASIATTDSVAATITIDEVTLAKALVELTASKPKVKRVVIKEPSDTTTTTTKIISLKSQDKGKSIMVEEPVRPKKKDQIRVDEEVALKLQAEMQAEFAEEQRLAREKTQKELEANCFD